MSKLIERCKAIGGATRRRRQLADLFLEESIHRNEDSENEAENEFEISDDLLFKVLILLPAASIFTTQFVCKKWHSLINTSIFIQCHARQSQPLLIICNCSASLESCDRETLAPKHHRRLFRFLDLTDGANSFVESSITEPFVVQASYDGLILATARNGNTLILTNPITREHIVLPSSSEHHCLLLQSFAIAFCNKAKTYKILHLYVEESGAIACRVMSIRSRRWTSIEEPRFGLEPDVRTSPVAIDGWFYWMCLKEGSNQFVCLSLDDEKFVSKNLPFRGSSTDQLLEIGGCVGLATCVDDKAMEVWVLVRDNGGLGEEWRKKYKVDVSGFGRFFSVVCGWRVMEEEGIVVENGKDLVVCEFGSEEKKVIHSSIDRRWRVRSGRAHVPHRNTLVAFNHLL